MRDQRWTQAKAQTVIPPLSRPGQALQVASTARLATDEERFVFGVPGEVSFHAPRIKILAL